MTSQHTIEATAELRALVRNLVTHRSTEDRLSMYVDLDPREFVSAGARAAGISAAIDGAGRAAPDTSWNSVLDDVRAAVARSETELDGAPALLLVATREGDVTIAKLPVPVRASVHFGHIVPVRPLVEMLERHRWGVLLCNRRMTRLLVGDRHGLEEVASYFDEVEGQHDRGGLAQARFERTIEGQVDAHLRDTAHMLMEFHQAGMFDQVLIAAPPELHGRIDAALHGSTRRDFAGFVAMDVQHSSIRDVADLVDERIEEFDEVETELLLAGFQQGLGRRERVAQGLDEVLAATREGRVETLLVCEGYAMPGWACPQGDWIDRRPDQCPAHGEYLEPVADMVEAAMELAIAHGSHVSTIRRVDHHADTDGTFLLQEREQYELMHQLGSIGALLRFDLEPTPRSV